MTGLVNTGDRALFTLFAEGDLLRDRSNIGEGDLIEQLDAGQAIDARIIEMRAATLLGVARKVQQVLDVLNSQEDEIDCWYRRMLRSVLADLLEMERRQGGRSA